MSFLQLRSPFFKNVAPATHNNILKYGSVLEANIKSIRGVAFAQVNKIASVQAP